MIFPVSVNAVHDTHTLLLLLYQFKYPDIDENVRALAEKLTIHLDGVVFCVGAHSPTPNTHTNTATQITIMTNQVVSSVSAA